MVKTYDPKQVVVTVGGTVIGGFADGTFIKVVRDNDMFKKSSGADGVLSRVRVNDFSGVITFTLAQTSPSNDVLSALANKDPGIGGHADVVAININDVITGSVYATTSAWPKKQAEVEYGKDIANREWAFDAADISFATLGNADA